MNLPVALELEFYLRFWREPRIDHHIAVRAQPMPSCSESTQKPIRNLGNDEDDNDRRFHSQIRLSYSRTFAEGLTRHSKMYLKIVNEAKMLLMISACPCSRDSPMSNNQISSRKGRAT